MGCCSSAPATGGFKGELPTQDATEGKHKHRGSIMQAIRRGSVQEAKDAWAEWQSHTATYACGGCCNCVTQVDEATMVHNKLKVAANEKALQDKIEQELKVEMGLVPAAAPAGEVKA